MSVNEQNHIEGQLNALLLKIRTLKKNNKDDMYLIL